MQLRNPDRKRKRKREKERKRKRVREMLFHAMEKLNKQQIFSHFD